MKTSDMIKSKYIKKEDLKESGPQTLTIARVTFEEFGVDRATGEVDGKYYLWFSEHPKALALNNTKIRLLEAYYGLDSDLWHGRKVRISNDPTVMMAGRIVGGVRLECSGNPLGTRQGPAPIQSPSGSPRPPVPVWNEATQSWDLPSVQPKALPRPPPPVWNELTGQWEIPGTAAPAPPQAAGGGIVGLGLGSTAMQHEDEDFNDDIPF